MRRAVRIVLASALCSLFAAALSSCGPNDPLDHAWDDAHCAVTFDSAFVFDTLVANAKPKASVYLRRHAGASALVIQLAETGMPGYPYPSVPTIRVAIAPSLTAPSTLTLAVDATDVRGPLVVAPGSAWAIAETTIDRTAPQDNWLFGTGSIDVQSFATTENDGSDRDTMTLDVTLDLSRVTVAPLTSDAAAPTSPMPIGNVLHVQCDDKGVTP